MLFSEQLSSGDLNLQPKLSTGFLADTSCLSSYNLLGWNGIDLEYYQALPGIIGQQCQQHLVLVFFSEGKVKQKFNGNIQVYSVSPGSIIVIPASIVYQISWSQPLDFALLILKPSAIEQAVEELENLSCGAPTCTLPTKSEIISLPLDGTSPYNDKASLGKRSGASPVDTGSVRCSERWLMSAETQSNTLSRLDLALNQIELKPQFEQSDSLIYSLVLALLSEVNLEQKGYCIYSETLSKTLAVHLFQKYFFTLIKAKKEAIELSPRLNKAIVYINANLDKKLSIEKIAAVINTSKFYFCNLFRQSMGISPYQYLLQQRIERSKILLQSDSELSIADISLQCGFSNQSHFSKCFRKFTGITPKVYRSKRFGSKNLR